MNILPRGSFCLDLIMPNEKFKNMNQCFWWKDIPIVLPWPSMDFLIPLPPWERPALVDHLATLSRYAQQMYVLYDGDNAGQQAIIRIGQFAWQASVDLKVISLPPGEDPASYLGKHKNLGQFIENSVDIVTFYIQTLGSDFIKKPLAEKLFLTRKIIDIISKLDDPLKQDILA